MPSSAPGPAAALSAPAGVPVSDEPFRQRKRDFGILPIPRHCQYDPERPFELTLLLNSVMAAAATFMVSNLYYNQPILIDIAAFFDVTYDEATRCASLIQAGYCIGQAFIAPMADIVHRRQMLLALCGGGTLVTIGLALTHNWAAFQALSLITGLFTIVPQVMNPIAADLAPPERRSTAVSIVITGLITGMCLARVVAGLFAKFTSTYRNTYFFAIGIQGLSFVMLWWFMPDLPKKQRGVSYWRIMYSMGKFMVTEPALVQACLIGTLSCAIFVSWWTNLTFLLEAAPFNYSAFDTGLFGLCGIVSIVLAPSLGRATDKLHPWTGTFLGLLGQLATAVISVACADLSLGPVIVVSVFTDVFQQFQQIGNQTRIYRLHPLARGRLNGCYGTFVFLGQALGSSAGSKVYLQYGWRAAFGMSVGWSLGAIVLLSLRGPYAEYKPGWFGWGGVYSLRKNVPKPGTQTSRETGEKVEREVDCGASAEATRVERDEDAEMGSSAGGAKDDGQDEQKLSHA